MESLISGEDLEFSGHAFQSKFGNSEKLESRKLRENKEDVVKLNNKENKLEFPMFQPENEKVTGNKYQFSSEVVEFKKDEVMDVKSGILKENISHGEEWKCHEELSELLLEAEVRKIEDLSKISEKSSSFASKDVEMKQKSRSGALVELFEVVNASGVPNFRKCRIPVLNSHLNISAWRQRLCGYGDSILCDLLEFGFPLDFNGDKKVSDKGRRNHKGARDYPVFIKNYLNRETSANRIAGPYKTNPLSAPLIVSPMNTVPKASEDERRVIVDLSWPHGASINDGISKDVYLGELINLHYASVEQVCDMVMEVGKGAHIYKRDLRHAYHQIPVDPGDYKFLGYHWDGWLYFDTVLAMGQRNAAMACSRTTKAIMYMHAADGFLGTSYLDDLIGVAEPSWSEVAYSALGDLLSELGLLENFAKACGPSTRQIVLGVLIDTVNGTVAVPEEKMQEIIGLVRDWQGKTRSTKTELQSLIGKLQFISKCVRKSRIFLNRLLETLRAMHNKKSINLSESFQKDLRWWDAFIKKYNGTSFIPPSVWAEPDVTFSTDSCLTGCGGICGTEYFHVSFPHSISSLGLPIHKLEMLAVLIGVRAWGHCFQGMRLQIYCDNKAAVDVINSSRTRDPFLASCLRELWLEVATFGFELRAVHLPGEENRVADWLSRWECHQKYRDQFLQFISAELSRYVEIFIGQDMFGFSGEL